MTQLNSFNPFLIMVGIAFPAVEAGLVVSIRVEPFRCTYQGKHHGDDEICALGYVEHSQLIKGIQNVLPESRRARV
ncbi:hypothetical protein JB92DRAFT_2016328 [Gautieria morchelliformis]|nr:hypothetical protein JB92DRAFT_2016328 [Gautieria morchelliformis]